MWLLRADGVLGVLRTLPGTKALPSCRDAPLLAMQTMLLIALGSKQPLRIRRQVSVSSAGCERLPLEATVLPGCMAPQIPVGSAEQPGKHRLRAVCLLGGSGIMDRAGK